MDSIVTRIMNHSKEDELVGLEAYLEKNQEVMLKNPHQWNTAVNTLADGASKYTMGMVWIAFLRSQDKEENPIEGTVKAVENLINNGTYAQLNGNRSTLKRWRGLIHAYTVLCRNMGAHRRALHYLSKCHDRFAPDSTHLTPAAADLVMIALKYNNVAVVKKLLGTVILNVDPNSTGVDATDYMAYHYYGGVAFTVMKNWKMAMRFCSSALRVPARAASQIMVEAYKVYMLCGVIANGRVPSIPHNTPYTVERCLKQMCGDYYDFAQACEGGNDGLIREVYESNAKVFNKEPFKGLMLQATQQANQRQIRALTKVYITLSIEQMASTVGVTEAEVQTILLGMIEEGTLNATILRKGGMVSFHDDDRETIEAAEAGISKLHQMATRLENLDDEVSLSVPYVTEKLRMNPNYRQLLMDYEQKRKAARGIGGALSDMLRGVAGN